MKLSHLQYFINFKKNMNSEQKENHKPQNVNMQLMWHNFS